MFTIVIFYLFVSFVSACILLYFMKNAPSGWEDENGFHLTNNKLTDVKIMFTRKNEI